MGTWGPGLYENDFAADLRESVALVCKTPFDGNRITDILLQMHQIIPGSEDENVFWLVLADQFERRGIACPWVVSMAQSIIDQGIDLAYFEQQGTDKDFLNKRKRTLAKLSMKLKAPRTTKRKQLPKKPPDLIFEVGQVFSFPTMKGLACHRFRVPTQPSFKPDGWGALVILEMGRAFEWFPWCALASLAVDPSRKPSLDDALDAEMIFHPQTHGAARCIPNKHDVKLMHLEPIGQVNLDGGNVKQYVSKWSLQKSIACGWTIAYAGFSAEWKDRLPTGPKLQTIVLNVG